MVSSPEGLTSCSTYISLLLDTVNIFRAVRVIFSAAWAGGGGGGGGGGTSKTIIHINFQYRPLSRLQHIAQRSKTSK